VKQIGAEFQKAAPVLAGMTVRSEVAVLQDYSSRWAINWQRHNKAFDPVDALLSYYAPLHKLAGSVDVVGDTAPLTQYKLVVAPALNVLTPEAAKNLEAYVRTGGNLVLGQRSAMKDEDNSLFPERQPGPLAAMLGARVEQFYALDQTVPVSGMWGDAQDTAWAEQLGVTDQATQVLMRYGTSNGWLDGQPAAVTHKVGRGTITYIGAELDAAAMRRAAEWMLKQSGVATVLPELPADVDVAIRSNEKSRVFILTNYGSEMRVIELPHAMHDVLRGGDTRSVSLTRFGVAVLKESAGSK
jgi:beta-galactosidase